MRAAIPQDDGESFRLWPFLTESCLVIESIHDADQRFALARLFVSIAASDPSIGGC